MTVPLQIKIKFRPIEFTIGELLKLEKSGKLNLTPHYQRNAIWTLKAQRQLIDTIVDGYPLPNFFFRITTGNRYEVVDGQQRCRAILAFWNGSFSTMDKLCLDPATKLLPAYQGFLESFQTYPLSVCILDKDIADQEVEAFYVLVNRSGLRLNVPELRKAEYYSTRFLALASELAGYPKFEALGLFNERSANRMNDIDYVSELLAYLLHGFTDKKEKVDDTYESDISDDQAATLKKSFIGLIDKLDAFQAVAPVNKTRFKQKNDFYSLFAFIDRHPGIRTETLHHLYHIMLRISPAIKPSQEYCDPLKEYALNCVTQSNSKKARESRNRILEEILLNKEDKPNQTQLAIAEYYEIKRSDFQKLWGLTLLPLEKLQDPNQPELIS